MRNVDWQTFYNSLMSDKDYICFPSELNPAEVEVTRGRNCFYVMVDIWADANAVVKEYEANGRSDYFETLLDRFHEHCNLLYASFKEDKCRYLIEECKQEEWYFHDVLAGDNQFNSTTSDVMKWFDRFCNGFNLLATKAEFS